MFEETPDNLTHRPDAPPFVDRRKAADRRGSDRQGKYDRRRNRCVACMHFAATDEAGKGLCNLHGVPLLPDAFACLQYSFRQPD